MYIYIYIFIYSHRAPSYVFDRALNMPLIWNPGVFIALNHYGCSNTLSKYYKWRYSLNYNFHQVKSLFPDVGFFAQYEAV